MAILQATDTSLPAIESDRLGVSAAVSYEKGPDQQVGFDFGSSADGLRDRDLAGSTFPWHRPPCRLPRNLKL
jgi:hypothetical protein